MDTPPFLSRQREDPNRLHACHWSKRIVEVDPFLLDEAARHEPGLVLDHRDQLVLLELEHPLQINGAMTGREIDQLPGGVLFHRRKFPLHCRSPGRVFLGLGVATRFSGVRQVELGEEARGRLWCRRVAQDVAHRAVSQWLIIVVEGVEAVFIFFKRSGELHAATVLSWT